MYGDGRNNAFAVVGVGASAGGLEAFQELIANLEPGQSRAFVLVQHLDPDHHSMLPELLARRSKVPIVAIKDGMKLEPGKVYLIPPAAELGVYERVLHLSSFDTPRGQRRPIDTFFESLASDLGSNCACIVLSGTGSDGSAGVKAVKEAGGLVFVQEPKQAKYDGMPKSAIATNAVDLVLPVGEMVTVLDEYFNRRFGIEPIIESDAEFLDRVSRHIRYRTGHDFTHYKKSTLMRRVARRMSVLGVSTGHEYLQRLITDHDEASRLFRDILINVTAFFRDPDIYETLRREVIPALVSGKSRGDDIRIWVPGCSTGQEPYSIAMLIEEELSRVDARPSVSVFATDIDVEALQVAREAVYPNTIVSEVPQHLLDRYFTSTANGYRIVGSMREMVRISHHSVVKDPPFSKLDFISCRNLLIYFDQYLQDRTLPVFHYALKPGGYLFLGPSENLGMMATHFETVSLSDRLFRRSAGPPRPLSLPLLPQPGDPPVTHYSREGTSPSQIDRNGSYEKAVLARHTPPHVVINGAREIVYSSGRTGRYLELPQGRSQLGLLEMAKPGIKPALRGLLASVAEEAGRIRRRPFDGEIDDERVRLILAIERLPDDNLLIVFQDRFDAGAGSEPDTMPLEPRAQDAAYVQSLEEKLDAACQTIRTTVEELETSNEELKSSNEEMMSMNEELQSANEELSTINEELQNKVTELNELNDDQRNLIESTRIATVFLDSELKIRNFTPEAAKYFRMVEHDRGRDFADIASELDGDGLFDSCKRTLETLTPLETERRSRDGVTDLLVRTQPYVAKSGAVGGVVITLTEITELRRYARRLEEAQVSARQRLSEIEELYRVTPQAKALLDRNLRYLRVNQQFADINGFSIDEHIGRNAVELAPQLAGAIDESARHVFQTGEQVMSSFVIAPVNGAEETRVCEIDWYPVRRDSEVYAVGVNVRDVTKHKTMEADLRRLMRELQHRVKNMLANVTALINRARREDGDPKLILNTLVRRIQALSSTHNLLTAQNWRPAPIRDVLKPELTDVYGDARAVLKGPDIRVNARATLALGMAVHELATNAAKYGALSNADGKLSLTWHRIDEGDGEHLVFSWCEANGPPVSKPVRLGFGSQLVRTTVEGSLGGRYSCAYEPAGFNCIIAIPYHRATRDEGDAAAELDHGQGALR